VGKTSERFVETHKRTSSYTVEDFILLDLMLSDATKIVVTPNILSETSNLLRHFSDPGRSQVLEFFKFFIENACEIYTKSTDVIKNESFGRLGLTDTSILSAQEKDFILLTDDLDLYLVSDALGRTVINFSHLREQMIRG
jgi:hypothetical protein